MAQDTAEDAFKVADRAKEDAAEALIKANKANDGMQECLDTSKSSIVRAGAAQTMAEKAYSMASSANNTSNALVSVAEAAKKDASAAQITANAAVPKLGDRDKTAGYSKAELTTGSQIISLESSDALIITCSDFISLMFIAGNNSQYAEKTIVLNTEEDTDLFITGAFWSGGHPSNLAKHDMLAIRAYFMAGKVILTVLASLINDEVLEEEL